MNKINEIVYNELIFESDGPCDDGITDNNKLCTLSGKETLLKRISNIAREKTE